MRPEEIREGRSYYRDRPGHGPRRYLTVLHIYNGDGTVMVTSNDVQEDGTLMRDSATIEQFAAWVDKELL